MAETPDNNKTTTRTAKANLPLQAAAGAVQSGAQTGATLNNTYVNATLKIVPVPVSAIKRHLNSSGSISLLGRVAEFLVFGSIPLGVDNLVGSNYDFKNVIVIGSIFCLLVGLLLWLLSHQIRKDQGKELQEYLDNAQE